jgi:arsenate reductase-like glutaredoxin family protein
MNRLTDIAQLTRIMENQEAKDLVVKNWDKVVELSKDEVKSEEMIDALIEENKETISVILAL